MADNEKAAEAEEKPKTVKKPEAVKEADAVHVAAVPVGEDRWQLKEHRNPGHWVCVQSGVTVEQLLDPGFWANVARHLQARSTIEVHWDDASQFAELYVVDSGRNWASVAVLRHHKIRRPQLKQLAEHYEVAFNGPVDRFRILRLSDREVIKAGFATEAQAHLFLADYKRKLAA